MKHASSLGSTRSALAGIAGTLLVIALLYVVGALTLGAAFGF
jgi:hypothetical protein